MTSHSSEQFRAANGELESFLERAASAPVKAASTDPAELDRIWIRMVELAPKVSRTALHPAAARPAGRPEEVQRYIDNLRALRKRLESVRNEMLARQAQLSLARAQLERLEGFIHAYHKTV